jgi:uncharacterized membrane protein
MKKLKLKLYHQFEHFETRIEEFSDWIAEKSASPWFLIAHIIWWGIWIGFKVEPFPYGLLTLIVSLEAIILSSLLLSSGNREGDIEKKIARKTLRSSTETNLMVEEIHDMMRDMQEDLRVVLDEDEM